MPIIAPVREVERFLQLQPPLRQDADLVYGGGDVTQHIVHGRIDLITIQGTRCSGIADTKTRTPQLKDVKGNQYNDE